MQTTYGTLLYSAAGSTWRVICEPQVRALAQQFLQQQGVALETTNVTTMETSR
ncbi:hypothetical protein [Stenotrophomonas maltophilia]|uniref:hypothetical protein n=1 Tax=Stenotrophomonas maltophilia TaxID=40324 RepID=UPI0013043C8D|nr:hypothetical protein [Stenotrophomonas maltophilia]